MKNERPFPIEEELSTELHDARDGILREDQRLAVILRDDGRPPRRAGVVAGIGEAGEALERNFQLKEQLLFEIRWKLREPRLARLRLFATQPSRIAQEVGVRIAVGVRRVVQW